MTYFIDFDRTLFDTPSFKKMLGKEFSFKNLWKKSSHGIIHTLATFFATGHSNFTPDELRQYLYPDVEGFLHEHGNDIVIVTYGVEAFIMAKVTNALEGFPLKRIVYTSEKKGHALKDLTKEFPGPWRFIDDAVFQLISVEKYCPQVELFEMRRDGKPGAGRWPVIHSLKELP